MKSNISYDREIINDDSLAMLNICTLKAERKKRRLTQLRLARITGISSAPKISRMEIDHNYHCSVEDYNKLAAFFHWEQYVSGRTLLAKNVENKLDTNIPIEDNRELTLPFDDEEEKKEHSERKQHKRHDDIKTYVRLPEALRNDLYTIASIQNITMSDLIIKLITDYTAPHRAVIDAVTAFRENNK